MTTDLPQTVLQYLQYATRLFKEKQIPEPRLESELLLAHALKCDRVGLYVRYDQPLTVEERTRFGDLLRQRGRRVPVQYILGYRDFWTFRLAVEPGVLIPRPDTECLVEEVLALYRGRGTSPRLIADVGTGSGCLAIALALEFPDAIVYAGDIADVPLRVALENVTANGVADRVFVERADGLNGLRAKAPAAFDLVVSNPPYITTGAYAGLQHEVREHEPVVALVSGIDGLDMIRTLTADATRPDVMTAGGSLFIEIGDAPQVAPVRALLKDAAFASTHVRNDYAQLPRVVYGLDLRG